MIYPWFCYSLIIGVFVLLVSVGFLFSKYLNKDLESLVDKLSYEEKKELEIQLKIYRIISTLESKSIRGNRERIATSIYDEYQQHDRWLKRFIEEVKSSNKLEF